MVSEDDEVDEGLWVVGVLLQGVLQRTLRLGILALKNISGNFST